MIVNINFIVILMEIVDLNLELIVDLKLIIDLKLIDDLKSIVNLKLNIDKL